MVEKIKHALTEGYDASRFIISTSIKKEDDGRYHCSGRLVQGRGVFDESGDIEWDDRIVTTETASEDYLKADNLALNSLYRHLIDNNFYLFDVVGEEEETLDKQE